MASDSNNNNNNYCSTIGLNNEKVGRLITDILGFLTTIQPSTSVMKFPTTHAEFHALFGDQFLRICTIVLSKVVNFDYGQRIDEMIPPIIYVASALKCPIRISKLQLLNPMAYSSMKSCTLFLHWISMRVSMSMSVEEEWRSNSDARLADVDDESSNQVSTLGQQQQSNSLSTTAPHSLLLRTSTNEEAGSSSVSVSTNTSEETTIQSQSHLHNGHCHQEEVDESLVRRVENLELWQHQSQQQQTQDIRIEPTNMNIRITGHLLVESQSIAMGSQESSAVVHTEIIQTEKGSETLTSSTACPVPVSGDVASCSEEPRPCSSSTVNFADSGSKTLSDSRNEKEGRSHRNHARHQRRRVPEDSMELLKPCVCVDESECEECQKLKKDAEALGHKLIQHAIKIYNLVPTLPPIGQFANNFLLGEVKDFNPANFIRKSQLDAWLEVCESVIHTIDEEFQQELVRDYGLRNAVVESKIEAGKAHGKMLAKKYPLSEKRKKDFAQIISFIKQELVHALRLQDELAMKEKLLLIRHPLRKN